MKIVKKTIKYLGNFKYLFNVLESPIDEYNLLTARLTGKSKHIALTMAYHITKRENAGKVVGVAFRKLGSQIRQSIKREIEWANRQLNVKAVYLANERCFLYENGNRIFLLSIYNSSDERVDLSGFNFGYEPETCIKWMEERTEFNDKDILAIEEALRGVRQITFNSANPWSKTFQFVKYCQRHFKFDINVLKEHKEFIGEKDNKLFHYSTIYINSLLHPYDIAKMEKIDKAFPERGQTVVWGMPGSFEGSIFGRYLPFTQPPRVDENIIYPRKGFIEFTLGVDYGIMKDKAAIVLLGFTENYNEAWVLESHCYTPLEEEENLTMEQIAKRFWLNVKLWITKWKIDRINDGAMGGYVDYRHQAFIEALNLNVRIDNYENYVIFGNCEKLDIFDRIILQKGLMSFNKLKIIPDDVRDELATQVWDEKSTEERPKRREEGVPLDYANALEYALASRFYSLWGQVFGEEYKSYKKRDNKMNFYKNY